MKPERRAALTGDDVRVVENTIYIPTPNLWRVAIVVAVVAAVIGAVVGRML